MSKTNISWATDVWNPISGCTKVSPGCLHCYAESITKRFKGRMQPYSETFIPWTVKAQRESGHSAVTLHPERLDDPLRWKSPRKVFVNSMSDLFHEDVPDTFISDIFRVMAQCQEHVFQVLTKRPDRMMEYIKLFQGYSDWMWLHEPGMMTGSIPWPLPNVWLGVSVENQRYADERIPLLLETPAAVRFISAEPLLEFLRLEGYLGIFGPGDGESDGFSGYIPDWWASTTGAKSKIGWVICGCESGPQRRPMEVDWARSLRDQCQAAGVPFFLKQMYIEGKRWEMPMLDGKVWAEYPTVSA